MPVISLRAVPAEDHPKYVFPITEYSFFKSPPLSTDAERLERIAIPNERDVMVLFEDETPVAMVGTIPMQENVRGKVFSMGAIAPVATIPQARRKGYARQLMRAQLKRLYEAGHEVSGLYPFRESFYERLGYVTFPQVRIAHFAPQLLAPTLKMNLDGEVEFLHVKEAFDTYRAFMQERLQHIHGLSYFPPGVAEQWRSRFDRWMAIARYQGQVVGLMTYQITGYRDTLKAQNFFYASSRGKYLLLSWLAHHADQVNQVELEIPPYEHAETWLSDLNIKHKSSEWVAPMGRVLNVRQIGGMQTGTGSFTARIIDPDCPWNEGSFRFATENGGLVVSEASSAAVTLTIQALSALAYGTHDPDDFALRGWAEGMTDELVATLRNMFPRLYPHMHEPY
jgi:predicted acetyltransferase